MGSPITTSSTTVFRRKGARLWKSQTSRYGLLPERIEAPPGLIHKPNDPIAGFGFGFDFLGKVYGTRVCSHNKDMADISAPAAKTFQKGSQRQSTGHYHEGGKKPKHEQVSGRHHPNSEEEREQSHTNRSRRGGSENTRKLFLPGRQAAGTDTPPGDTKRMCQIPSKPKKRMKFSTLIRMERNSAKETSPPRETGTAANKNTPAIINKSTTFKVFNNSRRRKHPFQPPLVKGIFVIRGRSSALSVPCRDPHFLDRFMEPVALQNLANLLKYLRRRIP